MPVDKETLNRMFDEAQSVKDMISRDWDKARDMLRGDQLPQGRPSHKPPAVLNLLRPLVERKTAMMTDTKPRFNVLPSNVGDQYAQAAKLLDLTLNAWWDDTSMDQVLVRALLYAQSFGTCITQTRWSATAKDIVVDAIDPRHFYVDPWIQSADLLHNAEYVIWEETPPLAAIKLKWGKKADEIKPWSPPTTDSTSEGWIARAIRAVRGPLRERTVESSVPRTLIRHFWIKDYAYRAERIIKDSKEFMVHKQLYPGGRYVVWAHDGVILQDKPNPYWDALHPFDMMDWYMDPDGPWGDGEIQVLSNPQQLLNKLAEVLIENAMLMNNAIWICDSTAFPASEDAQTGWGQLRNTPGQVVKKRPGTEVRREYPGGIPASVMGLLQHIENFIESKGGGFPEILSSGKAGQAQSGLGIEQLQMSASAMIRLKARALENLIQRVGQKCISRVLQFYTQDRVFHVLGRGNEYLQYVFIRENMRKALSSQSLKDAHNDFRFKVVPGSSLSMTRIQRSLIAMQLYQLGCVDRQALLESVEFPNWKEVLTRTLQEQMLGLGFQGGQKGSKRGYGPVERQTKIKGRT